MEHVRLNMDEIKELEEIFDRLWPLCRSITGEDLRKSFSILQKKIPFQLTEVPTGTKVFDWEIPKEWNIKDAYILTPDGKKIADFKVNNLHVVNYSVPVNKSVSLDELKMHLHCIPEMPDAIPYVTSYYKENWGFCIAYNEFNSLKEGQYTVVIDSRLEAGSLTYGECVLEGETKREILFSTYLCHPSMANNELSGPLVQAFLYSRIMSMPRRKYTYRFVNAPETIGVIAYLSKRGEHLTKNLDAGFVLTCCGDSGNFVYKLSKRKDSIGDKAATHVLASKNTPHEVVPFSVGGSDERQYCSPGFNLPVGSLTRSMYQRYAQYHTSLDNKNLISFSALKETVDTYFEIVKALELNDIYQTTVPFCEPQLGKRNLYPSSVNPTENRDLIHNRMHLLTFADGHHDLLDIANLRGKEIFAFENDVRDLTNNGLLKKCKPV
jgi:aminopeptidase-like protein